MLPIVPEKAPMNINRCFFTMNKKTVIFYNLHVVSKANALFLFCDRNLENCDIFHSGYSPKCFCRN